MRPTSSNPLSNSRTESEDDDSNAHQIQSVEATVVRTSRKSYTGHSDTNLPLRGLAEEGWPMSSSVAQHVVVDQTQ